MPAIKIEQFGGQLPAWQANLLPPGQAAASTNTYLFSGALEGWRLPKFLRTLSNSAAQFVYRIPMVNQSVATAFLVFLTQVNPGDIATVGEDAYTFVTSITPTTAPYSVLIGATPNVTAQNLLAAITFDNGAGTNNGILYSDNTIVNGQVAYAGNNAGQSTNVVGTATIGGKPYTYLQVFSPDFGAAYNATAVAESTAATRLVWLGTLAASSPEVSAFSGGTNPSFNSQITGNSTWLEFLDPDTNVIKTQVVNDIYQRYYWASPSEPPQYNTLARIQANKSPWLLGINPPGCAPTVTISGGGGSAQLGVTFSNGNTGNTLGNAIYLIPITPVGQMQLSDVTFMPASTDQLVLFAAVAYMDATIGNTPTSPGELVQNGAGEINEGIIAGTLAGSSFLNPPTLLANQTYWIGISLNAAETIAIGDGSAGSVVFANTFVNGPPLHAPAVTYGVPNLYLYADLATSAPEEARAYVYTWISAYGE